MRVLWITNNLLPDACEFFGISKVVKTGWLHSSANQIKNHVELYIATLYVGYKIKKQLINGITYILIPSKKDRRELDESTYQHWKKINKEIFPEVIHIHGTEYPIGLGYINACGTEKDVVSIQGLISVCANYYNAGMNNWDILFSTTLRDIIKSQTLWNNRNNFAKQGRYEMEYFCHIKNIIGRTEWDYAHLSAINPTAHYFFNNETLRDVFYEGEWDITKIQRHSIFVSQANYPLKGFHILLQAMPIILHRFPGTKIYVAGFDLTQVCKNVIQAKIRATTYGYYLYSLIQKLELSDYIQFLGRLEEYEMKKNYLQAHVFVSASGVENSSNSIGEAQLLGTPVVASFVGGTDSLVENFKTGLLYPFEDIPRLAYSIIRIFSDDELALKLSMKGREVASIRHDKIRNRNQLLNIYKGIIRKS